MDLATILGLILGTALIMTSIMISAPLESFVNMPSVLIVVGGTIAATMIRFRMGQVFGSMKIAMHTFKGKRDKPI